MARLFSVRRLYIWYLLCCCVLTVNFDGALMVWTLSIIPTIYVGICASWGGSGWSRLDYAAGIWGLALVAAIIALRGSVGRSQFNSQRTGRVKATALHAIPGIECLR